MEDCWVADGSVCGHYSSRTQGFAGPCHRKQRPPPAADLHWHRSGCLLADWLSPSFAPRRLAVTVTRCPLLGGPIQIDTDLSKFTSLNLVM